MLESGIVRNVDVAGRIVIPKEMRAVMCINEGDSLEIVKNNNEIILKKHHKGCIFCGGNKHIIEFMGMCVCIECKDALIKE